MSENKRFPYFHRNNILIIPNEYIKTSIGYNVIYETPFLLSSLPQIRHQEHQKALISLAEHLYKCNFPIEEYLHEWNKLLHSPTLEIKPLSLIRYGIILQNRNQFGDLPPQPTLKRCSILDAFAPIKKNYFNSSSPKRP